MALLNQGLFKGEYLTDTVDVYSTVSSVELVDGLTATKNADKTYWANGELEYTIVITNSTGNSFIDPILTDEIDPAVATLVENSVIVDEESVEYDFEEGKLTVTLDTIPTGESTTIKFKVVRV